MIPYIVLIKPWMQVGFMLMDVLARQLGIHMDKLQHNAAVGRGRLCEKRVLLAKPMTFMNNSGESVGKLARYYKVQEPPMTFTSKPVRSSGASSCELLSV